MDIYEGEDLNYRTGDKIAAVRWPVEDYGSNSDSIVAVHEYYDTAVAMNNKALEAKIQAEQDSERSLAMAF